MIIDFILQHHISMACRTLLNAPFRRIPHSSIALKPPIPAHIGGIRMLVCNVQMAHLAP